jgi:hypothetical protein
MSRVLAQGTAAGVELELVQALGLGLAHQWAASCHLPGRLDLPDFLLTGFRAPAFYPYHVLGEIYEHCFAPIEVAQSTCCAQVSFGYSVGVPKRKAHFRGL